MTVSLSFSSFTRILLKYRVYIISDFIFHLPCVFIIRFVLLYFVILYFRSSFDSRSDNLLLRFFLVFFHARRSARTQLDVNACENTDAHPIFNNVIFILLTNKNYENLFFFIFYCIFPITQMRCKFNDNCGHVSSEV